MVLEDNILIKYAKSPASDTFNLTDYIQFALSADTYSINDFNTKFKATVLRWTCLKSRTLSLSNKKSMHALPTISFSLCLVYLRNFFKKLTYKTWLYVSIMSHTSFRVTLHSIAKWLSVRIPTKWLWVQIPLLSLIKNLLAFYGQYKTALYKSPPPKSSQLKS